MNSTQALGGKPIQGDEYPLVPITAGIPPEEQATAKRWATDFRSLRWLVRRSI
ncbi:MAG: hypothetical protein SGI77_09195 [Pirellulaceae bacterium]|nr:hypothetical protein [Pirellulaceae bacterium]